MHIYSILIERLRLSIRSNIYRIRTRITTTHSITANPIRPTHSIRPIRPTHSIRASPSIRANSITAAVYCIAIAAQSITAAVTAVSPSPDIGCIISAILFLMFGLCFAV